MLITAKLISLVTIIVSFVIGIISFYVLIPLSKVEKRQYIEELSTQVINLLLFIWVAKIILNLPLFLKDPIVILTYPSNSQAFYLAILFSALLVLYKGIKKKLNMLIFFESGIFVFLVMSFSYELIQFVMIKDTFTLGYLALLAVLLCLYLLVAEQIKTSTLISIILVGWSIGMLFLSFNQPSAAVFGYLMAPWFIWMIFVISILFLIITRIKKVSYNGWN